MKIKDLTEGPELDRLKSIPGSIAGYFADLNKTFNKKSGFAGVSPPGTAQDRGPTGMGAIRGKGGKIVEKVEKVEKMEKLEKVEKEEKVEKVERVEKVEKEVRVAWDGESAWLGHALSSA